MTDPKPRVSADSLARTCKQVEQDIAIGYPLLGDMAVWLDLRDCRAALEAAERERDVALHDLYDARDERDAAIRERDEAEAALLRLYDGIPENTPIGQFNNSDDAIVERARARKRGGDQHASAATRDAQTFLQGFYGHERPLHETTKEVVMIAALIESQRRDATRRALEMAAGVVGNCYSDPDKTNMIWRGEALEAISKLIRALAPAPTEENK